MIRAAQDRDADALVQLVNQAFLVERFFIDSDRIDLESVRRFLRLGAFLIEVELGRIVACVYVEIRGERGYFGLLSVDPERQRSGFGRRLIAAAESYCREAGCRFMDLQIVDLRVELPAFYRKLGYRQTGSAPFPAEIVTKLQCQFVKMSKEL